MNTSEYVYKEGSATLKLHMVNDKIPIQKGIRQDETINNKLFTTVLKEVFK